MRLPGDKPPLDLGRLNHGLLRMGLLFLPVLKDHCDGSRTAAVSLLVDERHVKPDAAALRIYKAAEAHYNREPLRQPTERENILNGRPQ